MHSRVGMHISGNLTGANHMNNIPGNAGSVIAYLTVIDVSVNNNASTFSLGVSQGAGVAYAQCYTYAVKCEVE